VVANRLEEAQQAAARQAGEVAGEWKLRLAQAEAAHAGQVQALQASMHQQLQELQSLAATERSKVDRFAAGSFLEQSNPIPVLSATLTHVIACGVKRPDYLQPSSR
jgi:hypothetical protein